MPKSTPMRVLTLCASLTVLVLTGCNAGPDPVAAPEVDESWSAEDEAQAIEEAEQAVRDYWHVSTQCLADPPNTEPSCFDEVSCGDKLDDDRTALRIAQEDGVRYKGEPEYIHTKRVDHVDLSIGSDNEVRLSGCWSIENYDIVGSDGVSVIPPDAAQRTSSIFVVRKHASEWQVADILADPKGSEC